MDESPVGSENVVTFIKIHATVLGLTVGFLAGFVLAHGYEEPALGLGMSFVVDGPVDNEGYRWFKVDYDSAATGWSVGYYLR